MSREKKVLLIIGGSSDVGGAIVHSIAEQYDKIWIHYCHSREIAEQLKQQYEEKILLVQADFLEEESTKHLIETIRDTEWIPDHILHLPAVKAVNRKFKKTPWDIFEHNLQVSLRSIVLISQAFLPTMVKQRYGKIVFMLTAYCIGMPPKYQVAYVTEKYALEGLMKSLAVEYADKGITVNGVSPEMIETKFLSDIPELIVQQTAETNPIKRNLIPKDVAATFTYLLSDGADAVNGQNIPITAGLR